MFLIWHWNILSTLWCYLGGIVVSVGVAVYCINFEYVLNLLKRLWFCLYCLPPQSWIYSRWFKKKKMLSWSCRSSKLRGADWSPARCKIPKTCWTVLVTRIVAGKIKMNGLEDKRRMKKKQVVQESMGMMRDGKTGQEEEETRRAR